MTAPLACNCVGLVDRPPLDAACMKNRFGQVGPGTEANQLSNSTNSCASWLTTGICDGSNASLARLSKPDIMPSAICVRTSSNSCGGSKAARSVAPGPKPLSAGRGMDPRPDNPKK